ADVQHPRSAEFGNVSSASHFQDYVYIGGHSSLRSLREKDGRVQNNYLGCVQRIRINGRLIDPRRKPFVGDAVEGYGIADCSSGLCDRVQCENNGVCAITSASTFECQCPLGTSGTYCQQNHPIYLPQYNGFRSYTEYKGLQHTSRSETTLELTFKPAFPDGLILYQGFRKR
ncbi:hypothetical protein AHF37_10727, partial [Paragonimus kellicotti]